MHRFRIARCRMLIAVTAAGLLASFVTAPAVHAARASKHAAPRSAAVGSGAASGVSGDSVTVGHSVRNDVSPALRAMKAKAATAQSARSVPILPIPLRQQASANRADPAVQTAAPTGKMPTSELSFDGISFPGVNCNCAPPDPNGEVGDTQYVQIVNTALQVFDKSTGNSQLGPISIVSLWGGFGGVCETDGNGDPIVVFDQLANRWVVSQFAGATVDQAGNLLTPPTWECVAVSTSDDATGPYNRYAFDLGSQFGTAFYDYPKLGVWPDAYYLSFNVFNASGSSFLGPQPFALDRSAMLAGQPASVISTGRLAPGDDQLMPADLDGSLQPPAGAPNPFTEIGPNPTWKVWRFHADFTTPANSTFTQAGTLTPDPFNVICPASGGVCVPQAGVGDVLATVGDRSMFRNAYRRFPDGHEALVGNMTVQSGGVAGLRWYEIDNATSGTPSFVQQSTYQPDTTWRWMGSAAMDTSGDLAIGFSASSSAINPQIRYAGRLATDPPNTLGQGEATLFAGSGSQTGTFNRWGDYSDLTVDPSDDCTFWYTNEYLPTTGSFNWKTRIGNFTFPSCGAAASGTLSGTVTDASNNQPIADAEVATQLGSTTTDADGHYSITVPVGTYDVTYSAAGYATRTAKGVHVTDGNTTTMNVALSLPKGQARVSGTVTGTDCRGNAAPLAGAQIQARSKTFATSLSTDAQGKYGFNVSLPVSPLTMSAGKDGWISQTRTKVLIKLAKTTTVNFDLKIDFTNSCTTQRASVASDGAQVNDQSQDPSVSADGRYIAFSSFAPDLVPGDTNATPDVFVHDQVTGTTERVSVASDGTQADSFSSSPSISADGRYVAFQSFASNLVPGDTNSAADIFVHDRVTGTTERVSLAGDGTEADSSSLQPSISADGRYVAFSSFASDLVPGDTNLTGDVFVHDRVTGATELVSVASDATQADSFSFEPSISADGRYVAFSSFAANLVPGDTNANEDVFVHDRTSGTTERVSIASDGMQGTPGLSETPSISADGRYVAFQSFASNLVPGDTNGASDIFVHDRTTGVTERVSVASDGTEANSALSQTPHLSADGRYTVFQSFASNLVSGDTNGASDIFVHDRTTGVTERVSVASNRTEANDSSAAPAVSADGRYVAFQSFASNLVAGDTNDFQDVFVRDRNG